MAARAVLVVTLLLAVGGCGGTSASSGTGGEAATATSIEIDDPPATATPTPTSTLSTPPAAAKADYQLGGAYPPPKGTRIVSRDVTDAPAKGVYNICYVNGFQTQPGQKDTSGLVLRDAKGKAVADPGWPDEYLYDIRTAGNRHRVLAVVGPQIDACGKKGFNAVEPDNLDSWTRSRKLLTKAQAATFARLLIARAHSDQLAIAQKNTTDLLGARLGFDFAVAEECMTYDECGDYAKVYGRRIVEIEYTRKQFDRSCKANAGRWSIVLRDRELVPAGHQGYVHATC